MLDCVRVNGETMNWGIPVLAELLGENLTVNSPTASRSTNVRVYRPLGSWNLRPATYARNYVFHATHFEDAKSEPGIMYNKSLLAGQWLS
jgi:hypothetical protein